MILCFEAIFHHPLYGRPRCDSATFYDSDPDGAILVPATFSDDPDGFAVATCSRTTAELPNSQIAIVTAVVASVAGGRGGGPGGRGGTVSKKPSKAVDGRVCENPANDE